MELNLKIKEHRQRLSLSQEELAEQIFVSRQTVSNWETGKTYPDLQSLLRLSSVFDLSVDQMIKGDLKMMHEKINEAEIRKLDSTTWKFIAALLFNFLLPLPLAYFFGPWGLLSFVVLLPVTAYYSSRVEKMRQDHQIKSFKQILAFSEGKKLDEIENKIEDAKAPYQQAIAVIVCLVIGGVLGFLYMWLALGH